MYEQIYNYLTIETLYYWINLGVLPFWLLLIFFPQSYLCKYFVTSIFPIFLLGASYILMFYKSYTSLYDFSNNFSLYLSFNNLTSLFSNSSFLIMFWIHFLAINLFVGSWIVTDAQKFQINKIHLIIPLVVTYLIGPVGLFFYWFIRIFYARRINLYD